MQSAMKPLAALLMAVCAAAVQGQTFNSGSTGADGAFSPTVNTEVVLPASGILNYTSVNIPAGVTVTFRKNVLNTPVVMLVQGDATIAGSINVSGQHARQVGSSGDGNQGDDGLPGEGGAGGFAGGRGGPSATPVANGGTGLGPGGGLGGARCPTGLTTTQYGAMAGHGGAGSNGGGWTGGCSPALRTPTGGPAYGSNLLLPLIGGSGGGGGGGSINSEGGGGGGGGGAILIAASGTLTISGSIVSNGGWGGHTAGPDAGAPGGGGSGGALRLVATTVTGNGTLQATGGCVGWNTTPFQSCVIQASSGRIRIEGLTITRTATSSPADTRDTPGPLFIPNSPTIRIATVAGQPVPAEPTGNADVTLPTAQTNPVSVEFTSSNVPLGNTIRLTVTPANGDASSAVSNAISGTLAAGTASVSVTLPQGPSVLQAQTTYTIVASLGEALSTFANNERVERLEVVASIGSAAATVKLVTASGRRFDASPAALAVIDTFNAMQAARGS
jgi:hypothetical protein